MLTSQYLADRDSYLEELYIAWRAASAEADAAYAAWRASPGAGRYAVYVAATDQADAAAEQLAAEHAPSRALRRSPTGPKRALSRRAA